MDPDDLPDDDPDVVACMARLAELRALEASVPDLTSRLSSKPRGPQSRTPPGARTRRAPRSTVRTLRVWSNARDVTDENPATWPWPYSDWWAQGWRPAAGPNAGDVDEGPAVGPVAAHSTAEYFRE